MTISNKTFLLKVKPPAIPIEVGITIKPNQGTFLLPITNLPLVLVISQYLSILLPYQRQPAQIERGSNYL